MGAIVGCIGEPKNFNIQDFDFYGKTNDRVFKNKNFEIVLFNNNIEDNHYEDEDFLVITDSYIYSNVKIQKEKSSAYTILKAWCNKSLDDISGSYMAIIYDKKNDLFYIIRDLVGDRIFYYNEMDEGFYFSTRYKSIKPNFENDEEINHDLFYYLINVKKIKNNFTLFKDVKVFPQGQIFTITKEGIVNNRQSFSTLKLNIIERNEEQIINEIQSLLKNIVKNRIDGLPKVGIALSSGIDSVGLTYLIRKLYPNLVIHTFTTGYGEEDPEMKIAKEISVELNTIHHEIFSKVEDINETNLTELTYLLEDPLGRTETLQFLLLAREAKKYVNKIVLGVGGDGLFAGMNRHYYFYLIKKYPFLKSVLKSIFDLGFYGKLPKSKLLAKLLNLTNGNIPKELSSHKYNSSGFKLPKVSNELINEILSNGFIKGTDQSFQKYEKILTSFGIDFITPYHDLQFVKLAFTISDKYKIKGSTQKYIHRKSFEGIVNPKFIYIKKRPQKMLLDQKLFQSLISIIYDEVLYNNNSKILNFIKREDLKDLMNKNYKSKFLDMASMKLWTVLLLEYWFRIFSKNKINQKMKEVMPY